MCKSNIDHKMAIYTFANRVHQHDNESLRPDSFWQTQKINSLASDEDRSFRIFFTHLRKIKCQNVKIISQYFTSIFTLEQSIFS